MNGKCSNPDCAAPISCHEGNEISACPFWLASDIPKSPIGTVKSKASKKSQLTWTGQPMKIDELNLVSSRNLPVILGIVGKADAGKTTYLAMLFTLLLRGEQFKGYSFAGSKTIIGWDELYHKLKIFNNKVAFPEPTPLSYNRLHHLALRNQQGKLIDIMLSDASGEVFSYWSQNREDNRAENARWIYNISNAFILFIDCDDLIARKNQAKTEIIDMAEMLKYDLRGRPVIAVWSKADNIGDVHPTIKKSLSEELHDIFSTISEIEVSNFSTDDPDELVHHNNIKVIDWLLSELFKPSGLTIEIERKDTSDLFLNFKDQ